MHCPDVSEQGFDVSHQRRGRPSKAEALACLNRILASRPFCKAPRLSRFLSFLVENVLSGTVANLKEYTIGVDVFDREAGFDARVDPIVRVEARRLRQKLKAYYEEEGATDPIRIGIPERGYMPAVEYASEQFGVERAVVLCRPAGLSREPVPLAVANFSGDLAGGFAEGLTEELICQLSSGGDVAVMNLHSVVHSRTMGGRLPALSPSQVEFVLEGHLRREEASVRICVQLTSVLSGFCVWSQAFEFTLNKVLEAQKCVATQIAGDLRAYLLGAMRTGRPSLANGESSAHLLYSEGRMLLNSRTQEGIHHSVERFRELIHIRPQFALGYSGLADAYSLGARYNVFPHQESWERARMAALDAVRIDYSLAEAHTSLGFVDLHYRRDWGSAEREFCTAILLNPGYAPARQWYGWLLAATGNQEMAITAVKQAVEIDPSSPNAHADLALTLYFSRQYDEAIEECRRTMELQPGFYRSHQLLGMAHLQRGEIAIAIEHLKAAVALTKGAGRGSVLLAVALIAAGRIGEGRRVFAQSIEAREAKAPAIEFALFSSALGDLDGVFQWLDRAYQEQDAELLWLPVDPIYDGIRNDPRFAALVAKLGRPAVSHPLHPLVLAADELRQ